jgi:environmental stress-induced protein Ves
VSSPVRLLGPADYRVMPWRNGGGSTTELAVDGEPWTWRLSVARVTGDGPFSRFDGCARRIACLEGAGMELRLPSGSVTVPSEGVALRFSGDDPCSGRLHGGPVDDANLIFDRARWSGELVVARGGRWTAPLADVGLLHVWRGRGDLVLGDAATPLEAGATAIVAPAADGFAWRGEGCALLAWLVTRG